MMKSIRMAMALMVAGLITSPPVALAGQVESLRGPLAIEDESRAPEVERLISGDRPIPRSYVQQPPLIPHNTERYTITTRYNKCLGCHSWARYKEAGATKIPPTHFIDRDGRELANLAPRRYFCNQCHVTQTDTEPLVTNEFTPVEAIRPK